MPDRWPVVAAKFLFDRRRRPPRESDGVVTAFRDGQVTLRTNRRTEGFTHAVQEHGYQGIRRGDLVIHSMDGFAGAIGVSDSDGKASPVVHCYTPGSGVDPRFYGYLLRQLAVGGYITSLARGIRERSTAFDSETFRSLLLPAPPIEEQRSIADLLDTETARIDALISKKRLMIELLGERRQAQIDVAVDEAAQAFGEGPVAALCSKVVDCVNKTAPTVGHQTGFKMIRTSNVKDGSVDLTDVFHVEESVYRRWTRRGAPRSGDVLFTREAPVGEVGQLTSQEVVFLGQRLMMYRPAADSLPEYLSYVLRSTRVQEQIRLQSAGSLHEHLRVGDCSKFTVPLASLDAQHRVVERISVLEKRLLWIREMLERQLVLLQEHRQALITAAVVGELATPEAAA